MELLAVISFCEEIPERGRKPASTWITTAKGDASPCHGCTALPWPRSTRTPSGTHLKRGSLRLQPLSRVFPLKSLLGHVLRHFSSLSKPRAATLQGFPPAQPLRSRFAPFLVTFQAVHTHSAARLSGRSATPARQVESLSRFRNVKEEARKSAGAAKGPVILPRKEVWGGALPKGPPGKETRFLQRQRGFKRKK